MGTFNMKVRRSVDALPETAPAAAASAAPAHEPATILTSDGLGGAPGTPEDSVDEAVIYVTSPKVGGWGVGASGGGGRALRRGCFGCKPLAPRG